MFFLPSKLLRSLALCGAVVMRAAAADGCESAMIIYAGGDYPSAYKAFEISAKKGDACSQFQLAMMHTYGHGTVKDEKKAREWLKKAADNGFDKAKALLIRGGN